MYIYICISLYSRRPGVATVAAAITAANPAIAALAAAAATAQAAAAPIFVGKPRAAPRAQAQAQARPPPPLPPRPASSSCLAPDLAVRPGWGPGHVRERAPDALPDSLPDSQPRHDVSGGHGECSLLSKQAACPLASQTLRPAEPQARFKSRRGALRPSAGLLARWRSVPGPAHSSKLAEPAIQSGANAQPLGQTLFLRAVRARTTWLLPPRCCEPGSGVSEADPERDTRRALAEEPTADNSPFPKSRQISRTRTGRTCRKTPQGASAQPRR